ncbi:MAG: hypothetical protein H7301_12965 [Cryobacterium sp.]|nr:hypothetical protein [Oligoflexia bacterium]
MRGISENRAGREAIRSSLTPKLLALLSTCALFSCAPASDEDSYSDACVLPSDQTQTLTGRWYRLPVFISFRDGHFNSYELGLAMDAADNWNRFFGATQGVAVFDYGTRASPRLDQKTTSPPAGGICSEATPDVSRPGGYRTSLTIFKRTTWIYATSAIAITSTCTTAASPVKALTNAMMELNYQTYFTSGKPVPDLTSIFTHELGHLIGLDHSCAGSYDASSPTHPPVCSNSGLDSSYFSAVMYPSFAFKSDGVTGIPRKSLNGNDQGRTSCLYGPNALK